jgi:hypothetical protein
MKRRFAASTVSTAAVLDSTTQAMHAFSNFTTFTYGEGFYSVSEHERCLIIARAEDWLPLLRAMCNSPPSCVTSLFWKINFNNCGNWATLFHNYMQNCLIKEISMYRCTISPADMESLCKVFTVNKSLQKLDLQYLITNLNGAHLCSLLESNSLSEVKIREISAHSNFRDFFIAIESSRSLKNFYFDLSLFHPCDLNDFIMNLANNTSIVQLTLDKISLPHIVSHFLVQNSSLKKLSIYNTVTPVSLHGLILTSTLHHLTMYSTCTN